MSNLSSIESVTGMSPRGIYGANAGRTGSVGGTPMNPTDQQRKVFSGAVKDRLETDAVKGTEPVVKASSQGPVERIIKVEQDSQQRAIDKQFGVYDSGVERASSDASSTTGPTPHAVDVMV